MNYVANLRHFRQMANMTQQEVAESLRIPRTQLIRYEQGKNELPIRYLIELCYLYKVSADTILNIDIQNFTE